MTSIHVADKEQHTYFENEQWLIWKGKKLHVRNFEVSDTTDYFCVVERDHPP